MIIYIEPIWFKPRTYLDYDAVTGKNQGVLYYFISPSLVGEVHAIKDRQECLSSSWPSDSTYWPIDNMRLPEHHFGFSVRLSK